ncbi:MAG: twin-arginine translocation pathway signal protein [Altererythrobacter sp.]|nr:twin-arginine translocation pathway signal protein [Altererythrobacter sp.]MBK63031.1 twin-arginine translocation pathway signal protein [Altererythrobacter sp.]|tara:strand:+ start:87 stop:824 length:738 start_codon:yes stop_codon:yes gene_type:complete
MKFAAAVASIVFAVSGAAAIAAPEGAVDWVYGDGDLPEKWSITNEAYGACDAGNMQSPIDLDLANTRGEIEFASSYEETTGELKTGPSKVQVDVAPGMGMISGQHLFSLVQFHFHTPSEHRLHGQRYPLTVHLVHGTATGDFAVLGVMFEEGDENPALARILSGIDGGSKNVAVDVRELVPENIDVYRYMGSLTTPPCTEGVNWHVADQVLEASPAQLAAFERILGQSARSMQPLNNRLVLAPED